MENFYSIIRVTLYGYIINLDCFLGREAFNVRLLEFLALRYPDGYLGCGAGGKKKGIMNITDVIYIY